MSMYDACMYMYVYDVAPHEHLCMVVCTRRCMTLHLKSKRVPHCLAMRSVIVRVYVCDRYPQSTCLPNAAYQQFSFFFLWYFKKNVNANSLHCHLYTYVFSLLLLGPAQLRASILVLLVLVPCGQVSRPVCVLYFGNRFSQ